MLIPSAQPTVSLDAYGNSPLHLHLHHSAGVLPHTPHTLATAQHVLRSSSSPLVGGEQRLPSQNRAKLNNRNRKVRCHQNSFDSSFFVPTTPSWPTLNEHRVISTADLQTILRTSSRLSWARHTQQDRQRLLQPPRVRLACNFKTRRPHEITLTTC